MALHSLARWVENLTAGNPAMRQIETADVLNYEDGALRVGAQSIAVVDAYVEDSDAAREAFLQEFSVAITGDAARKGS
jgi:hypothetical protein